MNVKSSITHDWHIPRPSLSGSSAASLSDSRSRGGSASSQGSSSNHSTHSVSSGSMLLSAAHLARMQSRPIQEESPYDAKEPTETASTIPEAVVPMPIPEEPNQVENYWSGVKRGSATGDAQSIASSTHFTVVNGFTRQKQGKEPKSCCCSHSHQITVLVISMTILFSACILAAICFVEMRMRKETGIYKYS